MRNNKDPNKIKQTLAWYNIVPNLLWTVLNLAPVTVFCFTFIELKIIYLFLVISLIPVFLRNSFLDKIQIGRTTAIYKKLGVHHINKVAQNGVIINAQIKKKFPQYKTVTNNRSSISGLINRTYIFEKFHLVLFLFFCLITVYAIANRHFLWSFFILLTNVAYNIYPNLLQQYIRLKLILFNKKSNQRFTG